MDVVPVIEVGDLGVISVKRWSPWHPSAAVETPDGVRALERVMWHRYGPKPTDQIIARTVNRRISGPQSIELVHAREVGLSREFPNVHEHAPMNAHGFAISARARLLTTSTRIQCSAMMRT
jgi:hypothetical protein